MTTTVPNLKGMPPSTGASGRRDENERRTSDRGSKERGSKERGSKERGSKERGRGRARDDDDDLVDYIHSRDRLPRPILKHRESSREGKRRHEYRYYEPTHHKQQHEQHGQQRDRPRARSAERRRRPSPPTSSQSRNDNDRSARPRRMSFAGDDRGDHSRRSRDHGSSGGSGGRRGSDDTGKKRSAAQNLGKAAMTAGALEAVRQRGKGVDSGGAWKRVATAALGAAAIDAAAAKVRGRDPRDRGKKSTLGASLGGLVVEGLVHKMRP